RADARREGGGAGAIVDPGPVDGHDLLVAIGPFEDGDLDRAVATAGDRLDELRILEGAGDALMLQLVFALIDALGDVDGHDQRQIGLAGARRASGKPAQRSDGEGIGGKPHRPSSTPIRAGPASLTARAGAAPARWRCPDR